jgi:signal transduction histidine kinase
MSLRARILLAFVALTLVPIGLLAYGLRQEMTDRLTDQYQERVDAVVEVIREDLADESDAIGGRLESLEQALVDDNRFRSAAVGGVEADREYQLDYAGDAMRRAALSTLQILDEGGRIISSGHFRNEHGRIEAGLPAALTGAPEGVALVTMPVADGTVLALARAHVVPIGDRRFTLVGGTRVDEAFLARLARDPEIAVSLRYPGGQLSSLDAGGDASSSTLDAADPAVPLDLPLVRTGTGGAPAVARATLTVAQSRTPLQALLRNVDRWFIGTAAGTSLAALLLAVWISSRITRPLASLAEQAAVLDLDRLDVRFEAGNDEVGTLARLLDDLASRLRTSTARVREAERRATVGDLSRQITHDIRNGLIPLRNVMRHLSQVEHDDPTALPAVFAERRQTMDSSIVYLETLATSYGRLSPRANRRECDVNALVAEVVRAAHGRDSVEIATRPGRVPPVVADPVAFRRILENLTANAVDSLQGSAGRVTVSTTLVTRDGESPMVRVTVADTGRGMTPEESSRIFDDFYTTKDGGTGLGLSIVRRLVMDLNGSIGVESEPGRGTRIVVDLPAGARS